MVSVEAMKTHNGFPSSKGIQKTTVARKDLNEICCVVLMVFSGVSPRSNNRRVMTLSLDIVSNKKPPLTMSGVVFKKVKTDH